MHVGLVAVFDAGLKAKVGMIIIVDTLLLSVLLDLSIHLDG